MKSSAASDLDLGTDASGERLRQSVNPEESSRSTASVSVSAFVPGVETSLPERLILEPGGAIKHYEIIRELGQGGMGRVFLARDTKLGRLCALKLLLAYTGARAARFLAEARATARCKHENIVVIHDIDEFRGYPFAVLEYLEGRTLRAWMSQRGAKVPVLDAARLVLPLLRALERAHEMGIVHRDLKPENIFLTDGGQLKVLDFGIAKWVDPNEATNESTSTTQPQPEGFIGTPAYMSPEQWRGIDIDAQSDIWATGIILYEMLTGAHPLAPPTRARLAEVQNLDVSMPSVRESYPDTGTLGSVVDRCLKKNRAERIGSAKALLAEMESIVDAPKAEAWVTGKNPFAGLSAFQEADAERFFGRERDTATVLGRLRNQALVVVAGPSGAGKSSFVRAGVIAALKRAEGQWESFIVRPGRTPLSALAEVLTRVSEASTTNLGGLKTIEDLIEALCDRPGYLGSRLRAFCRSKSPDHHILLFVDQFEELYTLGAGPAERAAFLTCLEGAADDASSPLRVILSVRSDFLDRMAQDRQFMDAAVRGVFFLSPMGREEHRAALVRPLVATGHDFEHPDMVLAMLDALDTAAIPLPLLQFTATLLWERRDRERRLLTRESYENIGGVAGALATHADAVMESFSAHEQQIARAIFLQLVTPERTRAIAGLPDLRELDTAGSVEQIVLRLSEGRLLLIETGEDRAVATVELVHESLIESWMRLRRWLDENQEDAAFLARVRPAAKEWEDSKRMEGLLWRAQAAEDALRWQDRRDLSTVPGLGQREMRFLTAVKDLSVRERQRRRNLVMAVIASLAVVVVAVSVLAFQAKQETKRAEEQTAIAEAEKAETERNAVRARNATRIATARAIQQDPTTVLSILREIEPGPLPQGWAELAQMARDRGIAQVVLLHNMALNSAVWSPDGRHIAAGGHDKTIRIWNADGIGEPQSLRGHTERVYPIAWSRNGQRIVSGSADKTVRVWNADGTGEPVVLRGHEDSVRGAAFSLDGRLVAGGSADKTVRIWNADGGSEPVVLRGQSETVRAVSFSPDGNHVVSGSEDGTVRIWNTDGTGEPLVLRGHQGKVQGVSYSPDGQRIASGAGDGKVRVWNADGSGKVTELVGHDGWVHSVASSPDGKRIISASEDRTVRVWNADGTGEPRVLYGHDDTVEAAEFSADGSRILSTSRDDVLRVWNGDGTREARVLAGPGTEYPTFTPDGRQIVATSDKVRVYNADGTGSSLVLRRPEHGIFMAAFSPDNRRIAAAGVDHTVRIYNADGAGPPNVLHGHTDHITTVVFSPDSRRIASTSWDATMRIWNADGTGEPIVLRHNGQIYAAAFSPDGRRIASGAGRTIYVWNADGTGDPFLLPVDGDTIGGLSWMPDGRRIVSGSDAVRIRNADGTGQPLVLRGQESIVFLTPTGSVSPDGQRIVSSSYDGTMRIWNANGQGEPIVVRVSNFAVQSASWSPDGRSIVAAAIDKGLFVWTDLEPFPAPDSPQLWRMTTYCMPLDVRKRLLDFPEEQSRKDLERCELRVREARAADTSAR